MIRLLEYNRSDFKKWANNDELVNKFLQMRNKLKAPENDMGYWVNPKNGKSPEDLNNFLDNYKSNTQKRTDAKAGAKNVYEDDNWMCFKIETYDAAKFYGSGSKWCITGRYPGHESRGEEYFNSYLRNNYKGYYVVINKHPEDKENGAKWMVCPKQGNDNKVDIWCQKDFMVGSIPGFYGEIPGLPPLSAIIIKNGVASFNDSIDSGDNVNELILPEVVKEVAAKGFYKKGVRSLKLNDTLQKIGAGAFGGNDKLRKVIIPPSCKEIDRLAFVACDIQSLQFQSDCKIGERAFAWNDNIQQVLGFNQVSLNNVAEDAFEDSNVTFMLDPNDAEHIEFANKIGAKVIDRNGELING